MAQEFQGINPLSAYKSITHEAATLLDKSTITYKRCRKKTLKIYKEDYVQFSDTLRVLTRKYLAQNPQVLQVLFYKAIHGCKGSIDDGLKLLAAIHKANSHEIITIQIHYGCNIRAPAGSHIVLSYPQLTKVLGAEIVKENNYFLKDAGFFHGCHTPKNFPRVQYVHAYANIDSAFKNHHRQHSLVGYYLTNKFAHEKDNENRENALEHIEDLKNWLQKTNHSMDARVEAVEVVKNPGKLLSNRTIVRKWSCKNAGSVPDCKALGQGLWCILNALAEANAFLRIRGWEEHVDRHMRPLVQRLDDLRRRDVLSIPREYFAVAYGCEMLSACFIEGTMQRYDYRYVRQLLVDDKSNRDDSIRTYKLQTTIDKNFFENRHYYFKYIHAEAPRMLDFIYYCLQKLEYDADSNSWKKAVSNCTGDLNRDEATFDYNYRVHELMRRFAAMHQSKLQGGTHPNLLYVKPLSYFKEERKFTRQISIQDVTYSIQKSDNMVKKILCSIFLPDNTSVAAFVREHVFYWPCYLISFDLDPNYWAQVVRGKKQLIHDVPKSAALKKLVNLKQYNLPQLNQLQEQARKVDRTDCAVQTDPMCPDEVQQIRTQVRAVICLQEMEPTKLIVSNRVNPFVTRESYKNSALEAFAKVQELKDKVKEKQRKCQEEWEALQAEEERLALELQQICEVEIAERELEKQKAEEEKRRREAAEAAKLAAKRREEEVKKMRSKKQTTLSHFIPITIHRNERPRASSPGKRPPTPPVVAAVQQPANNGITSGEMTHAEGIAILKAATTCFKNNDQIWSKKIRLTGYNRSFRVHRKMALRLLKKISEAELVADYNLSSYQAKKIKRRADVST
ncbi:hypothetical protein TKK_0006365 [Trichogramma kaykai]